jgi:hypothetical protein
MIGENPAKRSRMSETTEASTNDLDARALNRFSRQNAALGEHILEMSSSAIL